MDELKQELYQKVKRLIRVKQWGMECAENCYFIKGKISYCGLFKKKLGHRIEFAAWVADRRCNDCKKFFVFD